MSAIARPRSGCGVAGLASRSRRSAGRDQAWAAAGAGPGSGPGSAPRPAVESHHEVVVWVGRAAAPMGSAGASSDGGSGSSAGSRLGGSGGFGPLPGGHGRAARRARAWYSGPCLRGSAYSLGLSVQYVPLVVPYQLAPPQSGSNGPSTPSYEVEPRVAFFGGRSERRRDPPPAVPASAPGLAAPVPPGRVPRDPAAPDPGGVAPPDARVRVDHDARPPSGPRVPLVLPGPAAPAPGDRLPDPAGPAEAGRSRLPYARRVASPRVGSASHGRRGPAADDRPFLDTLPSTSCS